jgi:hypothetical protein
VNIVAGEVQRDKELEYERVGGVSGCQETQQARSRATVGDHVEDSTKLASLSECACSLAIDGIKKARDGIQSGADLRMVGHVDKSGTGEDDTRVAYSVSGEQPRASDTPIRLGTYEHQIQLKAV